MIGRVLGGWLIVKPPSICSIICISLYSQSIPYHTHHTITYEQCLPACLFSLSIYLSIYISITHIHTYTHTYIRTGYRLSVRGRAKRGVDSPTHVDDQGMRLKTYEAAAYREGSLGGGQGEGEGGGMGGDYSAHRGDSAHITHITAGEKSPSRSYTENRHTENGHGHRDINSGIPEFAEFRPHVGCDILLEYDLQVSINKGMRV